MFISLFYLMFTKNTTTQYESTLHKAPWPKAFTKLTWICPGHGLQTANHDHEKFPVIFPHGLVSILKNDPKQIVWCDVTSATKILTPREILDIQYFQSLYISKGISNYKLVIATDETTEWKHPQRHVLTMCLGEWIFMKWMNVHGCHPQATFIHGVRKDGNGFPTSKLVSQWWAMSGENWYLV